MINSQLIKRDIVVIGASAGGVDALSRLFQGFNADFPGIIAVVLHRSPAHNLHLAEVLNRHASLPIIEPTNDAPMKTGTIYLAPQNHHLIFHADRFELNGGPKVHFTRPAVDPLFASAAEHFGSRVVGVLLTGGGDDGTSGCISIKSHDGLTIVQNPTEAEMPNMPSNALARDHVDLVLELGNIASTLARLARGEEIHSAASPTP